ncbi:MAG: TMEM175 family protein [Allomuricauda sp.]
MNKGRLEAFSDGVLAIIITIMVLEIKVPHGEEFKDLVPLIPIFLSYILSFIYLGIYWNNHHHMMQTVKNVSGKILWANLHLLFWLSLVPFVTGWMGENNFAQEPMALYGFILLMAAIAYYILQSFIIQSQGTDSLLAKAVGKDLKGKISPVCYVVGIAFAWINAWVSGGLFILVALIWLIPDKRIEKMV